MTLYYTKTTTPVGKLTLVANEQSLVAILWEGDSTKRVRLPKLQKNSEHPVLQETERQLREYFLGTRDSFDLPLDPQGTHFQQRVWTALRKIPYGETRSYGELAKRLGAPKASRAVGAANGRNPISIVVPCHRVIGSDGSLTGFAGGIKTKEKLLKLEREIRD